MSFEKLSSADLQSLRRGGGGRTSAAVSEYTNVLRSLPVGDGGRANVAAEGVSRVQIKNRIKTAAGMASVQVKFLRSSEDEVVFEVVDAANAPKRRGRKPKSA